MRKIKDGFPFIHNVRKAEKVTASNSEIPGTQYQLFLDKRKYVNRYYVPGILPAEDPGGVEQRKIT